MRNFIILLFCLVAYAGLAQDKTLLQEQLKTIMTDYPNQFKNLQDKKDSFHLKFQITGTRPDAMILRSGSTAYIVAELDRPKNKADAKALYAKWEALISSVAPNGAALKARECSPDKFRVYCKEWTLDNSKNNIAPNYRRFTLQVEIIDVLGTYAASIKAGDIN